MKNLKKILSVLTLIVLVGSDFLTSISYALDDMLEDSVVVQMENEEETESVESEEEYVNEEGSETVYEDESIEEELETENSAGDIVKEWTGEVSEIGSGEVKELTEETVEGITGDVEGVTGDVEELTGEVVESTEIGEEIVIEDMTYNEEPITGEKTYNDVTVRVEALTGIFPEGTELKIEPIKWWNLSSLKDKLVEEKEEIKEDTTVVAFDITFRYEGKEVQPKDGEKVKVIFDYSKNEELVKADKNENQEVKVYHIEDKDEEGNKVVQGEENVVDVTNKQESAEIGIAVVDADSFSIYVVTYGNEDPEFSATLVGEDSARNNFHYKTITISDGENIYTLMDRNLGARVAWNTGTYAFNDKSNYNTENDYYGYYYQWGNNYGFSNTQKYGNVISDAIPSNYVSSSWSTSNLGGYNLRGDTTNTESARQGPCPRGWHVPSANEWEAIKKTWCMSYNNTENCQGAGRQFAEALQMPTAGYRYYNYGKFIYASSGSNGYYWSSTSNDNSKANYLFFRSSNVNINTDDRVNGLQVRCLKNNTDAVTLYLNPNGGRVEDAIIDADEQGKVILPTATRNEYVFEGWFTSAGESEEIGDAGDEIIINKDTDLYAHWASIPTFDVIFNNGADVTEFEVESGGTLTDEQIQQILNLTHTKATFDGWYTNPEFNQVFDLNTPITEDISLYAKWTCKEGYISLQGNGGPDMNCFQYGTLSYEDANGKEHFLMDRNLGAQEIGYGYDANSGSYGYYYQWGNNYGFGPSSTTIKSSTQVDCTNINPSTYTSSTFITGLNDFDWCSSKNDNLWGGSTDDSSNNQGLDTISSTDLAKKGPCPEGWHVPSIGERQTLLIYGASLNSGTRKTGTPFNNYEMSFSNLTKFTNDFKIPIAGQLAYEGAQLSNNGGGGSANLWSSSPDVDYDVWARHFNLNIPTFEASVNARSLRAYGFPVRCFMNELKNTLTLNAGEGVVDLGEGAQSIATTGIVKGESFIVPTPTRSDHSFDGWFIDVNENGKYDDGEMMMGDAGGYIIDSMDDNITLTAKWKVIVTYDGNGGTSDKESDFGQPGDTIILPGANHQGKVFKGWNNETGYVGTQGDKYTLTRTETLLAQYYDYVVTFVYGNGERAADPIFVNNGDDDITLPSVLSVSGYIFDGWHDAAGNKIGDAGDPLSVNESRTLYAQGHYNSVELTDDNTTTTVGSDDAVEGFPITMTVIENDILESPEGEELSEVEGKELAGDVTIDFGGIDAKFSRLVKVKIPVKGSSKAYVKVKHVSSESYNYDGLTRNIEASCNDGNIENSDHSYDGAYIDVESGYVSIYTCEASNFAAFGLPKVTFEPNNGDDPIIVEVESGATVDNGDIPNVSNSGLDFAGWYTSEDDGQTLSDTVFDFDTPIIGNITLYAKWGKNRRITDQMLNFTWGEISIPRPASISTGPESYIIMDRNLGATSSGTVCDTGSNNGTCGLLYQFGNNYGFSYGNINMAQKCTEKVVDLRDYSPSNPYYDSTFVYGKAKCNNAGTDTDRAAISNYNIWGGQNGSYTDRQGPCPDEWHLPTQKEWEEAINYWTVGESDQGTGVLNNNNINAFRDYFQLPFAGGRSRSDGKISHVGLQGSYDTAQTNKGAPYILRITTTGGIVDSNTTYNQVNGYSIRCFKNIYEEEYYTVTFKNRDGDILRSGEVVAGETPFYSGSQPSRPATEQNIYSFNGWYPEITPVTSDVTYTATYTESPRLYTVILTGAPAGYGTLTPESLTKEYGTNIVISGDKLTVGGTEVILTGNEGYEFQEWTGTCEKIEKQVCDEFTVYSHPEPIEFTGGNNLIITNLGYDLFSESNYQKDFEISFDIVEQDLSNSVSQATILNVKDEDQEDIWPGFVVRKSGTAGKIEISATSDYGEGFQTKSYSLENLHNMKISRINSILYVSINGEANQKIYDYSGFYNYFTKPIVFGSSYKDSNHLFRPAKITLSNILIKSADNCYTGNVYVVTGDCQMTAAFSASDSHEVRIASNNTGYGTVSTESVTKPHGTSIIDNENGTLTIDDVTVTVTTGTAPAGHTYTFSGWIFSSECGSGGNYAVAEGCTITGNFEETLNTYTVTFDLSGGSLTGDMTLTKEYTIETPTISLIGYEPERNGYTFTGWYRDGTLITSMAGGETGDYTLVARWEAQERPIPVVVFMKMLVPGEYTDYDSNLEWGWGTVGELYTAPIEQFTHTGFYYEEDNENNVRSVIVSPNVDNEVHLYFSRIPYPLIITNAGEGISSTTTGGGDHLYEEPVTISVTPYTGWDFVSWSLSQGTLSGVNDLTQRTLSFNMPAEQVRISPILNHIPYTVTFDVGSGTTVESQTYYYDDLLSGLDNAITTKTGYSFSGWYLSGILYTSGSTMPAEDITLIAVWKANEYEVDASVATGDEDKGYLSGMGSTGISLTGLYDYATELVFIAIPELGYVFDYWKNGDTVLSGTDLGDGTNQLTVVVDQILDIIAFFKSADDTPYTVEHYQANVGLTGYDFVWSGTMYGTTNTQTNATGTDYEGFSLHDGDISAYQTGIKADGSTVVRLYYDRNRYIVTWNTWNGFEVTKTDVAYGQHPHFYLTPPERDILDQEDEDYDFTFTGWTRSGVSGIVDLETEIVTGDITYTAEYDRTLKYYTVKYYPGEGTGIMPDQTNLQLHTSGNLIKNTFTRTGYIFSGRYSSMGLRYEDEQEINMGRADGFEYDLSGNFFLSLEAQWEPKTDTKVTVNYYLKNLDVENNVLTGGSREYFIGVEFTGVTDDIVDIFAKYGTGIEGYEYSTSIVYGPDFPGGVETGTTTILADGSREIDMYYVPKKYNFTLNTAQYSSTAGSSESTGYYYGAKVILSGASNDDCFTWSGWTTTGIALSDNTVKQTLFTMSANDVEVTPSVRENTYNIIFNGNGNTSGEMLPMNGVRCTESTGLTLNSFRKIGYHFTGWSKTSGDNIREYTDRQTVSGLSKNDGENINLYAVWDANPVSVHIFHLSETLSGATMRLETGSVLTKVGAFYSGEVKTFPGFTYNPEDSRNKTGIIASYDGSVNEILLYYKRNQYPVRITNEGEGITNETTGSGDYLYEEPVTISVRLFTGWEFVDWTVIEGDLSGVDLSGTTLSFNMPAEQVRISPNLNHILYTVSFDAGLGTAVTGSQTYYYDDVLSGLDNAITTRTGYDFSGWYLSGVLYTSGSTMPAENITLTAVWDINKYDVSANVATGGEGYLSGMGNTGISLTGLYDFGESLVVIAIPELGYLFDYWEVNGSVDAETGNQLTIIVDQILDIVAHFKENVGTVTVNYYEMNTGGTYPGVANTATFTGLVGYTGYATLQPPVGFYLDTTSTVNTGIVISDNSAENVINIYYARNKHNITLGYAVAFLNPGSVTVIPTPRESGYYYGEDVHFEAIVSTGYVFKQWRVNGVPVAGGADGVDFVMGDEDVNLVVDGDLITYNIDYYTDPGSTDPYHENPHSYTVLSGEIEVNRPIAEFCHNFLGWTGGTTGDWILTPTTGLVIDSSKGGDRKYYANWERKSYDVELSVDPSSGGTVTGAGTYRCMGEIELHATSNTGYHFVGWYDTGGNLVSSNSMYFFRAPVGSLGTGLTAKFERNQYYITIDKNGSGHFWGESAPSGRYYHGTPITFIASPSYGYKIQKWTKNRQNITTGANNELYTGYILDVTVTETGNYEVYFEPETYNIIYMDSGRVLTGLSPATYTVENHVYSGDLPSITKDGYTFAGWFYEYPWQPEYQIQEIGYVPVDGQSVTILAGWMPIDYNINYHLLTGVEIIPWEEYYPYEFYQSYNIETERTNLPEPQKSGYVFSGWIDQNHNYLTGFGGGMTGNLDLYPTWKSDVMDITVNYYEMDTDGEYPYDPYHEYPTQRYYYTGFTNSTFTVPDYSKTGFSFQYSIFRGNTGYNEPVTFEVSENDSENIINVYYQRSLESFQLYTNNGSKYNVSPDCWSDGYGNSCGFYYGTEITINNYIYEYDEGYSFSGWNIDSTSLPDDAYLSDEYITFSMPDHSVVIRLETNHILYKLTFTGYEGAEVMNYDSTYASLTGENYYRFDSEIELPYLNKPGYNFVGWNEGNSNVWSVEYTSYPYHPIWNMPSHDVELTAVFEPRTDMEYYKYYYFQDTEGTGYSLSGYDRYEDGTTDQRVSSNCTYVEGFTHSRGEPDILYIKATGDNYINCYYDRDEYMVDVIYDDSKLSISGTGYYRYEAPVNLTATVKTGYEFSGFSSEWPEYNTTDSTLSFNVPLGGSYPIYAYAKPIVYSIEYEMYGGWLTPYQWYITGYTVDGDYDLGIFDAVKDGYTFLGWTGGEIGVREVTEPTKGLVIPLGSIGNRKYFANFEATGSNVTVNYYLKKIDPENNVLTGGVDEYISKGVVYTGLTDSVVDISALYGTGIEGYEYTTAIVYGSDFMDGIETGTTTILGDGSRSIDIYYTPKKYNFTVIQGQNSTTSGTSISTGYYFGAYVTLSGDSTDDCFVWDKWGSSDLPDGKNQKHATFEMPAHNVTVESMVSEKSYNILFDANGGTGTMSTLSVQCTTGTLSPNNFEKDGYTFTGWSRNAEGPVEFISEADVHRLSTERGGEVTLFAIWDINWYTVIFDLNGGSLTGDMTLTTGYTIETPAISLENYIPIKTGYNFSGWYKDNDLVNSIAGGETGNYTLIAKWEAIPFTVSFDTASGTVVESQIYYYNDVLSGLDNAITTKTGYNFSGWYLGDVLYTAVSKMPAKNIILTAKWTPRTGVQYQVNHRGENTGNNNYTTLLSSYKMYGTSDSQTVAESGNFAGFSLSGNVNQKIIKPDGTTVVDIYYNRNVYSIMLDNNGGTGVIELTGKYQAPLIVPNPSKSGYEFVGWDPELPTTIPSYNYTGIAMWNPSTGEYKVEFYYQLSDGTYPSVATSGVIRTGMTEGTGSVTAVDKNPTMSGYSFDSTNTENVLEGEIVGDGSLILKVYFKKQFTVKYLTGSQGTFPIDIHSDLDYGTGTPVFRGNTGSHNPGYTFSGWNPELKEIVTGNMAYEAQWKADLDTLYSVEYYKENLSGGYDIWTGMYTGETDTEVTALIRDFTGFTYSGGNQNNITSGVIAGDGSLVLKLFYDRNKYTITWKDGNNETLKTEQIFYGAIPVYSGAIPTKTATAQYTYTFNDTWSPNIEPVTTGATYSAQFDTTVNKYLIIFKDGDGNVIQSGMVAYGDTPIYTGATPTKTATAQYSYTFNNTRSPSIEFVTTGVSYIAQFDSSVNSYSVNIVSSNTDMGTISTGKINVEYGSNIVESGNKITIGGVEIVATPNLADVQYTYEFDNRTNTCGLELVGTCTIQANFKKTLNKYTITWKDDNGNVIDTTMVEFGIIPTHAKPTKAETEDYRYVFAGWNPEVVAVVGDAEYTATFIAEKKEQSSNGGGMSGGGGGRGGNIDNFQYGPVEEKPDLFTGGNDINSGNVDEETLSLYEWARQNNITTMNTLEEANPDGLLTRGHMAKMVVNFAQNVLGRTIPTTYPDKCNWKDKESDRESSEIKEYAKKACALGLMGIYVEEFMPNKILDRAEFGTVISRLLWGNKYNVTDTYHRSYYEDHLRLLKKNGILTQINEAEDRWEIRKWVWLVFRRIEEKLKNKGE